MSVTVNFRVIQRYYYDPGRLNETIHWETVEFPQLTPDANDPDTFKEVEEYREKLFNHFSSEYTRKYYWVVSSVDKRFPWNE